MQILLQQAGDGPGVLLLCKVPGRPEDTSLCQGQGKACPPGGACGLLQAAGQLHLPLQFGGNEDAQGSAPARQVLIMELHANPVLRLQSRVGLLGAERRWCVQDGKGRMRVSAVGTLVRLLGDTQCAQGWVSGDQRMRSPARSVSSVL